MLQRFRNCCVKPHDMPNFDYECNKGKIIFVLSFFKKKG